MPRDFDEVRKLASLPTRTVSLCLSGELVDEIGRLEAQLADAKPPTSLADVSPKQAIAEAITDLQEQMRESTVDFRLRALPSRKWDKFWAFRPARNEKETDDEWEARAFLFYAEMLSRSCIDPVMTVEQVGELVDLIHHKSWSTLISECLEMNMREVDIPNFDAASELTRDSEQT